MSTPPLPETDQASRPESGGFWTRLRANWRHYRARSNERVGFWFALLLLFAPIFYFLLYFRRYSVAARVGWGMWLGLVVYVKLAGLAEPIVNVERELRERPDAASQQLADTLFPKEVTSLEDFLLRLGGGMLGRHIAGHTLTDRQGRPVAVPLAGETGGASAPSPDAAATSAPAPEGIALVFRASERFFDSEESVALSAVEAAFNLIYGRGFHRVQMDFVLHELPLRLVVERQGFHDFFGMTDAEMAALTHSSKAFAASPVVNIPTERQREFLAAFLRPPDAATLPPAASPAPEAAPMK